MTGSQSYDVVIVGGGVIGLSIAYALSREGMSCVIVDRRELGQEASWAGAGLIPSISEAAPATLHPMVQLRSWSAELHPQWASVLREETGIDNGYRRSGGVDVACTAAEEHALRTTAGRWRVEGVVHECLAPGDHVRVEPALNPEVRLIYYLPDRAQIRNPWHLRALSVAAAQREVRLAPWHAVHRIETSGDRIRNVQTSSGNF